VKSGAKTVMIYLRAKSNSSRPAINGSNGKDGKRLYQISENRKTQLDKKSSCHRQERCLINK
jgi:hypothetical protein